MKTNSVIIRRNRHIYGQNDTVIHKFTIGTKSNISGINVRSNLDENLYVFIEYPEQMDVELFEGGDEVINNVQNMKIKLENKERKNNRARISFRISVSGKLNQGESIDISLKPSDKHIDQVSLNTSQNIEPDDTQTEIKPKHHNNKIPESGH